MTSNTKPRKPKVSLERSHFWTFTGAEGGTCSTSVLYNGGFYCVPSTSIHTAMLIERSHSVAKSRHSGDGSQFRIHRSIDGLSRKNGVRLVVILCFTDRPSASHVSLIAIF